MFIVTLHLAGPVLCNKLSGVCNKVYLSETLPDGFIWHFAILFYPDVQWHQWAIESTPVN